ncbi:MAG: hypothetical protein AAF694_30775 [Bacteroidota bacterium]
MKSLKRKEMEKIQGGTFDYHPYITGACMFSASFGAFGLGMGMFCLGYSIGRYQASMP